MTSEIQSTKYGNDEYSYKCTVKEELDCADLMYIRDILISFIFMLVYIFKLYITKSFSKFWWYFRWNVVGGQGRDALATIASEITCRKTSKINISDENVHFLCGTFKLIVFMSSFTKHLTDTTLVCVCWKWYRYTHTISRTSFVEIRISAKILIFLGGRHKNHLFANQILKETKRNAVKSLRCMHHGSKVLSWLLQKFIWYPIYKQDQKPFSKCDIHVLYAMNKNVYTCVDI